MATARTRRRTQADDAQHGSPPAVREPVTVPDFDFQDMVWGFLFAASIGGGNAAGAVVCAAGFAVQKQVRSDPETLRRAADYAMALVPGLEAVQMPALPWPKKRLPERSGEVLERRMDAPNAPARRPRWLEVVNDDMDRAPHTLIVGPSGAGKTTLAAAIMADRGGRSVVLSPKISAGAWRGAEVVTLDDDGSYAPLHAALRDLEDEKRARVVALRRGEPLEPLTVVLDELQDLTAHVPEAGDFMVNMASLGREIRMRLVGIGTTDDALNIRGWKASRRNYLRVELDRDRRATLSDGVREIGVPTRGALERAAAARLRPWRGEPEPEAPPALSARRPLPADAPRAEVVSVRVPAPSSDALLASLLAADVAAAQAAVPAIAPERVERLARAMAQRVSVAREGGDVHVHVQQVSTAATPPAGRVRPRGRGGLNTRKLRERADKYRAVERVILAGGSANQAQQEAQVKRETAQKIARQVRARHGMVGGSRGVVPGSRNRTELGTGDGSEAL